MKTRSQERNNRGLTAWQTAQLLDLIEENGGIDSFKSLKEHKTAQLFDTNKPLFGTKSSTQRRAFQNKVYKLKVKSPYEYLKELNKYKVTPHANREQKPPEAKQPSPAFEHHRGQDINEDSDESSELSQKPLRKTAPTPSGHRLPKKMTSFSIRYDATKPTSNHGIAGIFGTKNIIGLDGKSYFEGFDIWVEVDPRYMLDQSITFDVYKASVFSERQVLICFPAWSYSFFANRDQLAAGITSSNNIPSNQTQRIIDSLDNALHVESERPGTHDQKFFKKVLVEFQCPISLDPIAKENVVIKPQMITENTPMGSKHWVIWTVARTDIQPQKRGRLVQSSQMGELQKQFSQMLGPNGSFGLGQQIPSNPFGNQNQRVQTNQFGNPAASQVPSNQAFGAPSTPFASPPTKPFGISPGPATFAPPTARQSANAPTPTTPSVRFAPARFASPAAAPMRTQANHYTTNASAPAPAPFASPAAAPMDYTTNAPAPAPFASPAAAAAMRTQAGHYATNAPAPEPFASPAAAPMRTQASHRATNAPAPAPFASLTQEDIEEMQRELSFLKSVQGQQNNNSQQHLDPTQQQQQHQVNHQQLVPQQLEQNLELTFQKTEATAIEEVRNDQRGQMPMVMQGPEAIQNMILSQGHAEYMSETGKMPFTTEMNDVFEHANKMDPQSMSANTYELWRLLLVAQKKGFILRKDEEQYRFLMDSVENSGIAKRLRSPVRISGGIEEAKQDATGITSAVSDEDQEESSETSNPNRSPPSLRQRVGQKFENLYNKALQAATP